VTRLNVDFSEFQEVLGTFEEFNSEPSWAIFDEKVEKMLSMLSRAILTEKSSKEFPDLISIAFAIRPTNLKLYRTSFVSGIQRKGRGRSFHITPANVPLNFVFSYVFALLAGNPCLIRLSSREFPQVNLFNDILKGVLQNPEFDFIKKSTCFVKYPHNQKVTDFFSKNCEVRVIWGGDSTIRQIRLSEIPTRAIELTFPDRYSFSLLNADHMINIENEKLDQLIEKFFADAYLFDQRGCSSPKLVCWTGSSANIESMSKIFWAQLRSKAEQRYDLQTKSSMDKFVDACLIASSDSSVLRMDMTNNFLLVADAKMDSSLIGDFQGRYGTFLQCRVSEWSDLELIVSEKFQTMTYFGYDRPDLIAVFSRINLRGIDRIVPVGQAFDVSINWDGINFVEALSRIVDFK
jgi:hypothetical protein